MGGAYKTYSRLDIVVLVFASLKEFRFSEDYLNSLVMVLTDLHNMMTSFLGEEGSKPPLTGGAFTEAIERLQSGILRIKQVAEQHLDNDPISAYSVKIFTRFLSIVARYLELYDKLEAETGHVEMTFPYFINKAAPVSGVQSLMDYEVTFIGEISEGGAYEFTMRIVVPVTSLCPCSKKISEYGAHNQRSHVTVTTTTNDHLWIEELVQLVEGQASCELYGLLKRPDEKFVTERAYDNPKFVEDMVRDVAGCLNKEVRIDAYTVESENFESIHNHSAYALIEHDKRAS